MQANGGDGSYSSTAAHPTHCLGFTPKGIGAAYTPEARKCVMRLVLHADPCYSLDVRDNVLQVRAERNNCGESWYDHVREIRFSEFAPLEAFKYQSTYYSSASQRRKPPPNTPMASAQSLPTERVASARSRGGLSQDTTVQYMMKLREEFEAAEIAREQGTRIVLLGLRCLSAFNERDVPYIMSHLTTLVNMGKTGQQHAPLDVLHRELQMLYEYSLSDADAALDIMVDSPLGEACLRHLYFMGWNSVESPTSYLLSAGETMLWLMKKQTLFTGRNETFHSWSNIQSILDVRAFLCVAYGKVALNSVYTFVHILIVVFALLLKDEDIVHVYFPVDAPICAFLCGTILEEATQFWEHEDYLSNLWNLLDFMIIMSESIYFLAMGFEPVSRFCLGVTPLFLLLRILAGFRNSETMPVSGAGTLIRTTIAMLSSIKGFLLMFMYVIVAFALVFYFIFHGEFDGRAHPDRESVRRLKGVHHEESDDNGADPFSSLTTVFLWLFHAVLGDFRYTDMHGSQYEAPGIILLTVFLLVSSIILLNFMIAILSGTYDRHEQDSKRLYLLDLGKDALTLSYHPSMRSGTALPILPRPANLLNVALRACFGGLNILLSIVSCCCGAPALAGIVAQLDRIHFKLHLFLYFALGNLVMVAFTMMCRLWMTFFCIVGTILFSPFTLGCFLVNVCNGSLIAQWTQFSERGRLENTKMPGVGMTLSIHLLAFCKSLRFNQLVMLSGPLVALYLFIVKSLTSELQLIPGADVCLETIDAVFDEMSLVTSPILHDQFLEHRRFFSMALHATVLALMGAVTFEVFQAVFIFCGGKNSRFIDGWSVLVAQAAEHYMCPPSKRNDADQNVTATLRKMLSRSRSYHVLQMSDCDACDGPEPASNLDEDVETYMLALIRGEDLSTCDAPRPRFLDMHNCLAMLVAFLDQSRPLIRQAIMKIYNVGDDALPLSDEGPFEVAIHRSMAMYISLEDWYWVVDSIANCMLKNERTLVLTTRDHYANMDELSKERLKKHPLVGLYCLPLEDDSLGVLFEDFFWALYQGSFFERYCRVDVLIDELWKYTWMHEVRVQEVRIKDVFPVEGSLGTPDEDAQMMESLLTAAADARGGTKSNRGSTRSIHSMPLE